MSPGRVPLGQAFALLTQRKLDEAIVAVNKAVALDPSLLDALRLRATLRHMKSQRAEAISDLDQAIKLAPEDNAALTCEGRSWRS